MTRPSSMAGHIDIPQDGSDWAYKCHTYWAAQFWAMRRVLWPNDDPEDYTRSLSSAFAWAATGGKSGATFAMSVDERFVVKAEED